MPLTKEEIQTLPLLNYEGKVELITNPSDWLLAYEKIKNEKIIGFDTETKPTYVKGPLNPPAIMQLATAEKVYIIQFFRMKFHTTMRELLANEDILKVGVAIRDDMIFLQKLAKFKPAGVVDVATIAHEKGYQESGLRTLCAALLNGRLSKTMQCSNWERIHLSKSQIQYAATDAWVSRKLYTMLIDLPTPEKKKKNEE